VPVCLQIAIHPTVDGPLSKCWVGCIQICCIEVLRFIFESAGSRWYENNLYSRFSFDMEDANLGILDWLIRSFLLFATTF
jgi:hypothetical protein